MKVVYPNGTLVDATLKEKDTGTAALHVSDKVYESKIESDAAEILAIGESPDEWEDLEKACFVSFRFVRFDPETFRAKIKAVCTQRELLAVIRKATGRGTSEARLSGWIAGKNVDRSYVRPLLMCLCTFLHCHPSDLEGGA